MWWTKYCHFLEFIWQWAYSSRPEIVCFWVRNLETWRMKYRVGLEPGNWKLWVWQLNLVENQVNNQQFLRKNQNWCHCWENPKINTRSYSQVWNPNMYLGPDPKKNDPEIDKLNFWSTLIGPVNQLFCESFF